MKNIALLLFFSALLAACGHRSHSTGNTTATASAYICPMDCEKGKSYPQPGQCPVCKMDLEGKPADNPSGVQTSAQTPVQQLQQETMAIHDEAMKEMADMNRVKREMKDFMTRAKMTKEGLQQWQSALAGIEAAEATMMSWMAEYKEPVGQTEADAMKYLQAQKEKILACQASIQEAAKAGQKLMGKE